MRSIGAGYAELHSHSSFSFLDGASSPEEMVDEAVELGLSALAITDHNGMSGVVRFARAAKDAGLPAIFGAELSLGIRVPATQAEAAVGARQGMPDPPGAHLLALARDPAGYSSLCAVISRAQLLSKAKGRPVYDEAGLAAAADGHWLILTGCRKGSVRAALESAPDGTFALDAARRALDELVEVHGRGNVAVEISYARDPMADEHLTGVRQRASRRAPKATSPSQQGGTTAGAGPLLLDVHPDCVVLSISSKVNSVLQGPWFVQSALASSS